MSQSQKHIKLVFVLSLSILLLTWCQKDVNQINDSSNDFVVDQTVSQTDKKLVIHPWCVGCGKCYRFAPQNFTMEWRQAVVTSQENIDSVEVSMAISWCPVSVIEIVEA